ncbi:MAG TPA: hypothetical protein VF472_23740 [Burkholderiaceae bacterium]
MPGNIPSIMKGIFRYATMPVVDHALYDGDKLAANRAASRVLGFLREAIRLPGIAARQSRLEQAVGAG